MIKLPNVTLLGVDCVDVERLIVAATICLKDIEFGAVKILSSKESPNWPDIIKIPDLNSVEAYSEFMIKHVDDYVDTDFVLIFQYDGFVLNAKAWTDDFLKYDYIGAPWMIAEWSEKFGVPQEYKGYLIVGNGGFCLRSKKFTRACKEFDAQGIFNRYHPEDIVLCFDARKAFQAKGLVYAPVEVGKHFSFEAENDLYKAWDGQFGFHGFRWTDISKWTNENPEYDFTRFMR